MSSDLPAVVVVYGPTGSGKTDVAVRVARALGTEVVNCDPQQCYRGFPILTNQPGPEHDAITPHRLVGCWGLDHEASVAEFAQQAHAEIDALVADRGHAVLCSGSGLYLLAAACDLQLAGGSGGADRQLRAQLAEQYDRLGSDALHARLASLDPAAAARVHPNDRKRVIRALEVTARGGSIDAGTLWDAPHRHPTAVCGLAIDRALVHGRINQRTRAMFEGGVLDEVAGICGDDGRGIADLSSTAQHIHGLQDTTAVLAGAITRDEGIERLAARTRQYARRQDTWARRWPGLVPVPVDPSATLDAVGTLLLDHAREGRVRA